MVAAAVFVQSRSVGDSGCGSGVASVGFVAAAAV